jgi:hypothetical protein
MDNIKLPIPALGIELEVGNRIKLGRFCTAQWIVQYGWYSIGGDRPVCGWYLTDALTAGNIKPLHLTDLDDINIITT